MILTKSPISPLVKYRAIFCTISQDKHLFDFWARFYRQFGGDFAVKLGAFMLLWPQLQNYIQGTSAILANFKFCYPVD